MIELRHVSKAFDTVTPLTDVNAVIEPGDVISIIGPSGTGKSTLLNCINLLDPPTGGEIWVDGECITARGYPAARVRRKVGMVFQSFHLFPHLTVVENVMKAPVTLLGLSRTESYRRAVELLDEVGLSDQRMKYPDTLSGGQKQRVAIARALAMEPAYLLFDEPTSALDPLSVREVQSVIRRFADRGMTMLIVTHDMLFARTVANRVFYMDEGIIYEQGAPEELFDRPQREKTRLFFRRSGAHRQTIVPGSEGYAAALTPAVAFCRERRVPAERFYRVCGILEEFIALTLPRLCPEGSAAELMLDCADDGAALSFVYPGEPYTPGVSEPDEMTAGLLRSYAAAAETATRPDGRRSVLFRIS